MNKERFLREALWQLTTENVFANGKIYEPKTEKIRKKTFQENLQFFLDCAIIPQYEQNIPINDNTHLKNISRIVNCSRIDHSHLLKGGELTFGVSQNLLNLYLKYLWSIDIVSTPPHFPVDNNTLKKLKLIAVPWTKMNSIDYLKIINHSRSLLKKNKYKTIAELELNQFHQG